MKKKKIKPIPIQYEWRLIDTSLLNDKLTEVIKVLNKVIKNEGRKKIKACEK